LTNVGMSMRPDLFDPHTVHFHGFPNAAPVFDGMPDGSFGVNMGSSLTYFYNVVQPGTFMYHCHQEAAEHMQMGMLGQIYVRPAQDGTSKTYQGRNYTRFVYNDGDGSTGYDKSYAIQLSSMDHMFHELHLGIQPLPFANMRDTYAMLNGRGYPDTTKPGPLPGPAENGGIESQKLNALMQIDRATEGNKLLLRLTNLSVTNYYTLATLGLKMHVVGSGAHIARGPGGKDLYYDTNSVTLGGGESADVIIDTAGVPAGTYFLYTSNLNYLSNFDQDFGGMMTEIVIQ
ncbi:MAG: multicopper oxidase domain-containing protein, partial [Sideroxydans sp.]|nr:multicopper oxidase domain-containing protein [Sideroxydans sp.]